MTFFPRGSPAKSSWTRFLPKILTNLPKILTNLPKILTNLPKILTNLPKTCPRSCPRCQDYGRPISGQDLGQDLTQDMARSQPPGKILSSCQDLALLGKNLAQELFAGGATLGLLGAVFGRCYPPAVETW